MHGILSDAQWPSNSLRREDLIVLGYSLMWRLLCAKVEVLMGDNRLSLASASVGIMDDIIHCALFAPPITGDLLQDRIDSLHPPADERDELPDIVDKPEVPCLQITAEQFRARCYRLSRTSSPGTTGWTNNILSILCDHRTNPGFVLGTTPPNALHHAFTTLGNTVLQGRIVGVGRDLFVCGRLALIPKNKVGNVRPIRVECSISAESWRRILVISSDPCNSGVA